MFRIEENSNSCKMGNRERYKKLNHVANAKNVVLKKMWNALKHMIAREQQSDANEDIRQRVN